MSRGIAGKVTAAFIDNPVTPILTLIAFALGAFALIVLPREEEPQIRVPLVDVIVSAPGLSADDATERITKPLETALSGIKGRDHVYARTTDGRVVLTVRFKVGVSSEDAVVRVDERVRIAEGWLPPAAARPLVVGRGIEDVAVLVLTVVPKADALDRYGHAALYEIADALRERMAQIDAVGLTYVRGRGPSELRVEPDPEALTRWGVSPASLLGRVEEAARVVEAGRLFGSEGGLATLIGGGLATSEDIGRLLVTTRDGRPVYVGDLADIVSGAPQPGALVWHRDMKEDAVLRPAASLAVAKKPSANGARVAEEALLTLERARGDIVPGDVEVITVRNYGETATANARALLLQLLSATAIVVLIIGLFIGLREALVVGVVVPTTILLTFFSLYMMDYTINRVTLFALIFAIGILVDDAIVVVENIPRHWGKSGLSAGERSERAVEAVDEVGNPTIISTLTIIAALLPMAAVSGLIGPYLAPIPVNAAAAVSFSTLVALSATPWLMVRLYKLDYSFGFLSKGGEEGGPLGRTYRWLAAPLLATRRRAFLFLLAVGAATLLSAGLFLTRSVTVKLLPFDDQPEMQVVLNMPEGTPVEDTDRLLRAAGKALDGLPELESLQYYAGTSAPYNFNGLVRQYYLRESAELGDLKLNLSRPGERERQSHQIALEVRERLKNLELPEGAALRIAEVPPGPPVFAVLLGEIYGPDRPSRLAAATTLRRAYEDLPFITDVDDTVSTPRKRLRFVLDRAALDHYAVSAGAAQSTLMALLGRHEAGPTRQTAEAGGRPIVVELSREDRLALDERLLSMPVPAGEGEIALSQIVEVKEELASPLLFRRNGRPLIMVLGNMAGRYEAPIYGMIGIEERLAQKEAKIEARWRGQPTSPEGPVLLWDGEWRITYIAFRDMGGAFAIALLAIYAIVVWRFQRLKLPLLVMVPVPLTLVGVMLGHLLTGATFTATSMIGFIALAGIVVRNSILLIEFVEMRRKDGTPVRDAAIDAGALRFKPIFLTAVTAMVGAAFIFTDPIFKGLAVSLIFGLASSTLLTVLAVPAVYVWRRG